MMLIGAVIVVSIFYLELDVGRNMSYIVLGAAMTVIGWLLQLQFGKKSSRRKHSSSR